MTTIPSFLHSNCRLCVFPSFQFKNKNPRGAERGGGGGGSVVCGTSPSEIEIINGVFRSLQLKIFSFDFTCVSTVFFQAFLYSVISPNRPAIFMFYFSRSAILVS